MSLMIECEKCGNGLMAGDLKCKICGHFSGRACGSCGRHVPSGKRICDVCGMDLGPEFPFSSLPDNPQATPDDGDLESRLTKGSATLPLDPNHGETPAGGETRPLPPEDHPTPVAAPLPVAPTVPPPIPPSSDSREPIRLDATDYPLVLKTCQEFIAKRGDLYGVFGRPESGKTCFIYALGKLLKGWHGNTPGLGNYSLDRNWENLIHYQEQLFESGVEKPTARGLHFYTARAIGRGPRKRHFAMIDIRGEQFEQIDDWTHEITDFFLTYLTHCKGLFLFLELDPDTVSKSGAEVLERRARKKGEPLSEDEQSLYRQAWRFKRDQMSHMVSFLSVAATVDKVANLNDYQQQLGALKQAHREERFGAKTVAVPVVLCISKADLIKDYRFDGFPAIVPGADDYLGNPWNVIETFFPKELDAMKRLVPRLKVEWVSSTGENFNPTRGVTHPLGMASAFRHVVSQPPPKWAMSARNYQRLARFFGLERT